MELLPIRRAIISVTDKTGVIEFASFLVENGVELVSTGGTKKILQNAGLPVVAVSEVTGFPEILNGRVKTLHPHIHAGILASKDNPDHISTLEKLGIQPFDLVCVNLYDFSDAVQKKLALPEAVEKIDIGGPCLLRAAAKNFSSVLVLPLPECYPDARKNLEANNMAATLNFRRMMASRTFETTSRYDAMIASYLRL